jgi:hypothetical protein
MWLMVPCPPVPSLRLCRNSQASNYSQNFTAGRRGAQIRGRTSPCKPMTAKKGMPPVGEGSWSAIHEPRAGELCGCAMHRATIRASSYLTRRVAWTFAASQLHTASLLIWLECRTGLSHKQGWESTGSRRRIARLRRNVPIAHRCEIPRSDRDARQLPPRLFRRPATMAAGTRPCLWVGEMQQGRRQRTP